LKRLIRKSWHNESNRDAAIAVINGEVFQNSVHAQCINDYLMNKDSKLNDNYNRPDLNESSEDSNKIKKDINSLAFCHLDNDDKTIFIEKQSLFGDYSHDYSFIDMLKNAYPNYKLKWDTVDDKGEDI
jgi:hypothetical protein